MPILRNIVEISEPSIRQALFFFKAGSLGKKINKIDKALTRLFKKRKSEYLNYWIEMKEGSLLVSLQK